MPASFEATGSIAFSRSEISRSAETAQRYEIRFDRLLASYRLIVPEDASLVGYAEWLGSRREELAASSYRQYRAATISVFEAMLASEELEPTARSEIQRAIAVLRIERGTPLIRHGLLPSRTSALKQKRISATDCETLVGALSDSPRRHARAVLLFFSAGIVSGLRPSEWIKAKLFWHDDNGQWDLRVQNGKGTNGRSHGPTRTLSWSDRGSEVQAIQDWLMHLATYLPPDGTEQHVEWTTYYAQLRDTLREVCLELWPGRKRRPTFYTTRHTFAAVAKTALAPTELAALLGHGSDLTALIHYARPPKGSSRLPAFGLPRPSSEEVARVRLVLEKKELSAPYRRDEASTLDTGDAPSLK